FGDFFEEGLISAIEIGLGASGELKYPSFPERMGWRYPGIGEFQIPAIYWWYRTASHAAELTAGFHNPTNQDGYASIFNMLKKHSVTIKFMCCGPQASTQENEEALADAEALSWQVTEIVLTLCPEHSLGKRVKGSCTKYSPMSC
ncbi:hypothetical protein BHE74_00055827, partial [Ensete ventricosum]